MRSDKLKSRKKFHAQDKLFFSIIFCCKVILMASNGLLDFLFEKKERNIIHSALLNIFVNFTT